MYLCLLRTWSLFCLQLSCNGNSGRCASLHPGSGAAHGVDILLANMLLIKHLMACFCHKLKDVSH